MANSIKEYDLKRLELRDDDPVDVDQFDDETHDQVANTLVKLITEKEGGFAIGLEGSWGSGKSTVAKITEQKIEDYANNQNKYVFFTFDTWAHQGDPIRRSFLECLAGKLFKEEIINKRKWYRHVSKIRASEKKINTTSKPNVPFFSYIMAFYALLAPFILFWAHSEVSNGEITDALKPALFFIGLPIITAFVTWIIREKCELKTKGLPVLPTFRYLKHEMTTVQSIKTKDATTIEFNDHFDKLLKVLEGNGKKLIVILDNLDRISSDEFISMWGTMRNFFTADKDGKRERLLRNVYLIVPFDHDHINEIFSKASNKISSKKQSNDTKSDSDQTIGEEFVDKTFRLVLDVAQPINTNWKSFFTSEIKKAFGGQLTQKQLHDLQKLFDLHHQENVVSITPRRVKKFINDLILQLYERNGEIPLKYLALYVLNKNKIKDKPSDIITGGIVHERTESYLIGEDWAQNVLAAHYKVTPQKALQLVLDNRISNALLNNKIDEIEEMKEYVGFNDALSKVIEKNITEWAKTETDGFVKAAKTLRSINLNNHHVTDDIWRIFALKTKNVGKYATLNKMTGEGLSNIIANAPSNLLETTIEQICKKIQPNVGEDVNAEIYSKDFFDLLIWLSKSIVSKVGKEKSKIYLSKIDLPADPRVILHLASQFNSEEEFQFKNYRLHTLNSSSIQELLLKNIEKGLNSDVLDNSLVTLFKTGLSISWNMISDQINNRLQRNKILDEYEYLALLSMLTFLKFNKDENAKNHISNLTKQGFLLGVLNNEVNDKLKAIIVFHNLSQYRKIENVRTQNNAPVFGNINTGHKKFNQIFESPEDYSGLISSLADFICTYNQMPQLMKIISENPGKNELLILVLQELLDDKCINGLRTVDLLNYYTNLELGLDDKYINKLFNLVDKINLQVDEINDLRKVNKELLISAIKTSSKFGSELYNRIKQLLSSDSYNEEFWLGELKNEGHILNLVITLISFERKSFIKRVDFREALLQYTEEKLLVNDQPKKLDAEEWSSLPKAMSKINRESFYKLLYSRLISEYRKSEYSYNIFNHYGEEFTKVLDHSISPDKFAENVLLDLINSNDEKRLNWIIENSETVEKFLGNVTKSTRSKLEEAIESKHEVEDNIEEKLKIIKGIIESNMK